MQPLILTYDPAATYFFDEGCHINELCNGAADPVMSIAQARVAAGVTTRWHALQDITERYVILSGTGSVEIGDLPAQTITAGAVVLIPPGCRQRIRNCGDDELVFLAICSPRFRPAAYRDLEDQTAGKK